MIILVDSNIVIWGIKKQSSADQVDMIAKAERFFEHAQQNKIDILIPTAVVAEILSPEPTEKHAEYLKTLHKYYIITDLDARVAKKTAELLFQRSPEVKKYIKDKKIVRDKMKFDHVIVASALVHGANCIYSHDDDINKIAGNLIHVMKLPDSFPKTKLPKAPEVNLFGQTDPPKKNKPRKK